MNNCIKITLVANAGVLVEHNEIGILVDGMHHEEGHSFSQVSSGDLDLMRQGGGIFTNLDYLLFTHDHPDHFTPQLVSKHLRFRSVKGLFIPNADEVSPHLALLHYHLQLRNIPLWPLGLEPGETKRFQLTDDLTVTVIGTKHMGPQFQAIRNDCFLLTLAGTNLLFTGDADHVPEYFEKALENITLEAVFVNPIFYHHPNGQKIINDIFRPRALVIYHMSFEQDDTLHFSYMVQRYMEKHDVSAFQTHVLKKRNQTLYFPESIKGK